MRVTVLRGGLDWRQRDTMSGKFTSISRYTNNFIVVLLSRSSLEPLISLDIVGTKLYCFSCYLPGPLQAQGDDILFSLRWFCFKKAWGRVFHVAATNSTAGRPFVKRYFLKGIAIGHTSEGCQSFTVLPADNSTLSRNCNKWTSGQVYEFSQITVTQARSLASFNTIVLFCFALLRALPSDVVLKWSCFS